MLRYRVTSKALLRHELEYYTTRTTIVEGLLLALVVLEGDLSHRVEIPGVPERTNSVHANDIEKAVLINSNNYFTDWLALERRLAILPRCQRESS